MRSGVVTLVTLSAPFPKRESVRGVVVRRFIPREG